MKTKWRTAKRSTAREKDRRASAIFLPLIKLAQPRKTTKNGDVVCEVWGGQPYEYYPLGEFIVMAPGICGGRPTFKYTRIEALGILDLLAAGATTESIVSDYDRPELPPAAVREAVKLAAQILARQYAPGKVKATVDVEDLADEIQAGAGA